MPRPRHGRGGSFHRPDDAVVHAAAAEMPVERGVISVRVARDCAQQRRGRDQDAGKAIAALPGLLVEKRLLQRVQLLRPAPRPSTVVMSGPRRGHVARARIFRLAVDQHHAGAALLDAAAEPGAAQRKLVAQYRQQRLRAVGVDVNRFAVDDEGVAFSHLNSLLMIQSALTASSVDSLSPTGERVGVRGDQFHR